LSASRFAIRFDKNLGIASAENEKNEKIAGGGSLALKDLPISSDVIKSCRLLERSYCGGSNQCDRYFS